MSTEGWQVRVSAWLQHAATLTAQALDWVPGWVVATVLVVGFALLLRRGLRTRAARRDGDVADPETRDLPGRVPPADTAESDTVESKETR